MATMNDSNSSQDAAKNGGRLADTRTAEQQQQLLSLNRLLEQQNLLLQQKCQVLQQNRQDHTLQTPSSSCSQDPSRICGNRASGELREEDQSGEQANEIMSIATRVRESGNDAFRWVEFAVQQHNRGCVPRGTEAVVARTLYDLFQCYISSGVLGFCAHSVLQLWLGTMLR
jgi:hypothetical protein